MHKVFQSLEHFPIPFFLMGAKEHLMKPLYALNTIFPNQMQLTGVLQDEIMILKPTHAMIKPETRTDILILINNHIRQLACKLLNNNQWRVQ
jgi:hypothetical protein